MQPPTPLPPPALPWPQPVVGCRSRLIGGPGGGGGGRILPELVPAGTSVLVVEQEAVGGACRSARWMPTLRRDCKPSSNGVVALCTATCTRLLLLLLLQPPDSSMTRVDMRQEGGEQTVLEAVLAADTRMTTLFAEEAKLMALPDHEQTTEVSTVRQAAA